jgi:hypothetical protein
MPSKGGTAQKPDLGELLARPLRRQLHEPGRRHQLGAVAEGDGEGAQELEREGLRLPRLEAGTLAVGQLQRLHDRRRRGEGEHQRRV